MNQRSLLASILTGAALGLSVLTGAQAQTSSAAAVRAAARHLDLSKTKSLVLGGTGMLAEATQWLAARSERTLLVARGARQFAGGSDNITGLDADWNGPGYAEAIRAAAVVLPAGLPAGGSDFNDLASHAGLARVAELVDAAAADLLLKHGAKKIYAGVSHAVLGEKGRNRIAKSPIVELLATNSTPQATGDKVTALDIAPLLAQAIARIHGNESVTSLFDTRG